MLYPLSDEWRTDVPEYYQTLKETVSYFSVVRNSKAPHAAPQGRYHQVDDWWDNTIGDELEWLLERKQFDVLFVNYVFLSKALEFARPLTIKVLDTHDMFAGRREMFERQAAAPEFFYTDEAQERIGLDRADIVIAVKQSDAELLRRRTAAEVITIPYWGSRAGTGLPEAPVPMRFSKKRPLRIGFIGADNSVNTINLRMFIALLEKYVVAGQLPVVFKIAGNVCRSLGSPPPFVQRLGWVDSLADFYSGIDVVVVPFAFSTGIKIKVAEALGWCKPVVATRNAFDGFAACHPAQELPLLDDVCRALADVASARLQLAALQEAARRAADAARQAASDGFERLQRRLTARTARILILTDTAFWQRASLFDEWVAQWAEQLARLTRVVVIHLDPSDVPPAQRPSRIDFIRVAPGALDLAQLVGGYRILGVFLAFADHASRELAADACAATLAEDARRFSFVVHTGSPGMAPQVGLSRADMPDAIWPLAPFRYLPGRHRWHAAAIDRSRLLVVTATPACEWADFALRLLRHLAAARDIAVVQLSCGEGEAYSPAFARALLGQLPLRTVLIGPPQVAWIFCRHMLDLARIPHLLLAPDHVAPLVRRVDGLPSLAGSIAAFLDDAPLPLPAPPASDAGWDCLQRCLVGAAAADPERAAKADAIAEAATSPPNREEQEVPSGIPVNATAGRSRPAPGAARFLLGRWRSLRDALDRTAQEAEPAAEVRARWLHQLDDAVRAFYREWSARGDGATAYRLAFRAVRELCTRPAVRLLWREECALIGRFFGELPIARDRTLLVGDSLCRIVWQDLWGRDLKRLQSADFAALLQVRGIEHLPPAWQRTGIIFVHWHAWLEEAFWRWLTLQQVGAGLVFGRARWDHAERDSADPMATVLESARELRLALDELAQGRHVHILADGYLGRRGIDLPLFGRIRGIQPSFAQLAMRSGAPIHPVGVALDRRGIVAVRIGPAFPGVAPRQDGSGTQVARLVERYVEHLAREWNAHPAEIMPRHMLRFMMLPQVAAAATAAPASPDPRIAICLGLYSSGSTWVFNVIRQIWQAEAKAGAFRSLYLDSEMDLPLDIFDASYIALKTHKPPDLPTDSLMRLVAICRGPVIVSIRDPRDAVASLMQRFGMPFDRALDSVAASAQSIMKVAGTRTIFLLRYEDGFVGSAGAFDAIAAQIGATPSSRLKRSILHRLTPDAVSRQVELLSEAGVISEERPWDPQTHWHRGHVGDGRVGKYGDILSDTRQRFVLWRTASFCQRFGYVASAEGDAAARLIVVTDVAFWDADTLFAEWVRQWTEAFGRVMPILVLYPGGEPRSGAAPPGFDVVMLPREPRAVAAAMRQYRVLGVMFAWADAEVGTASRAACAQALANETPPLFEFEANGGGAPCLRDLRAHVGAEAYPIAPVRALPRQCDWARGALDRTQVLVITREPAQEWDSFALEYLGKLARTRGLALRRLACKPGAEHSPDFFRQAIGGPPMPTVFIGRVCLPWGFLRHILDLAQIPHLLLADDCILPLVRNSGGAPSLLQSVTRFLDDVAAPRAAIQVADAGWDTVCAALVAA
jgi:hypothetical protein